jgi:hypothetical protein
MGAAKAAFTEAVTRNPKSHVMLCERSRIISVHRPGKQINNLITNNDRGNISGNDPQLK